MTDTDDIVVVEEPLEIRLQGEPFQVLMRLPGLEKELALGFLFTEGIVQSLSEVITIHFCGTATDPLLPPNVVDVNLTEAALARRGRRHLEVSYSSCGLCAKEAVSEIVSKVPPVQSDLSVTPPSPAGPDGAPARSPDHLPGHRRHPRRGPGRAGRRFLLPRRRRGPPQRHG